MVIASAICLSACAVPGARPAAAASATAFSQVGTASWYGRDFHRKRTASGERFNMNDLTAAHRSLPLDSLVRVTNLENGRAVVVRINDRGPYERGRIIDLSARAARVLGMKHDGVARVRLDVLPEPEESVDTAPAAPGADGA
jgi:rare lipoprotein A